MTYGSAPEVRALVGNYSLTEVPEEEVATWIVGADALIRAITGKTDWTETDAEYPVIEKASNLYAAAAILDHFEDKEGKAKTFREEFYKITEALKESDSVLDEEGLVVVALDYRTSPLSDETGGLVLK